MVSGWRAVAGAKVGVGRQGRAKELGAPHTPVLLAEVLEWLRIKPEGIYVDATLGAGGHSAAIAERLSPGTISGRLTGRLISLDRDAQALGIARERLKEFASRVMLVHAPFSKIAEVVQELGLAKVDGVLADLGVSSMQLDRPERGFSFREAGPLDMRMSSGEAAQTKGDVDVFGKLDYLEVMNHTRVLDQLKNEPYTAEDDKALGEFGI